MLIFLSVIFYSLQRTSAITSVSVQNWFLKGPSIILYVLLLEDPIVLPQCHHAAQHAKTSYFYLHVLYDSSPGALEVGICSMSF